MALLTWAKSGVMLPTIMYARENLLSTDRQGGGALHGAAPSRAFGQPSYMTPRPDPIKEE